MSTLTVTTTSPLLLHSRPSSSSSTTLTITLTITCGPRDNRGPLVRGRTLSTEAILAVQSLKRSSPHHPENLSRLLKPDLVAALSELLRQDLPLLALSHLLPLLRSDPTYSTLSSLSLYADLIKSLTKNNLHSHLLQLKDQLVEELDAEGGIKGEDLRGPARLVKSLMAAGSGDGVMEVYGLMKKGGCLPNDYLFKYVIRGLRKLGEEDRAREVERDYEGWVDGGEWGVVEEEAASV